MTVVGGEGGGRGERILEGEGEDTKGEGFGNLKEKKIKPKT